MLDVSRADVTAGALADALDIAHRHCPRLTWVIVPDHEIPDGDYLVDRAAATLYFARSLRPDQLFTAWFAAIRELLDVPLVIPDRVVALHFRPGRDRVG